MYFLIDKQDPSGIYRGGVPGKLRRFAERELEIDNLDWIGPTKRGEIKLSPCERYKLINIDGRKYPDAFPVIEIVILTKGKREFYQYIEPKPVK